MNVPAPPQNALSPLAANFDSLYVGYHLDWLGLDWEKLALEKERLLHDPRRKIAEFTLGGLPLALHRSAGQPYSYRLACKDFSVRFGRNNNFPNCYVQFPSEALWRQGVQAITYRFEEWHRRLGARALRPEKVSRADVAFDFHLPQIDFGYANFRSQAQKDARWNKDRAVQSYQFGKGDVVLRFYDKSAEIAEQSQKFFFYDIWGVGSDVWRVEWQVRGDRLTAYGINTLPQLFAHTPELIRALSETHTTLRSETGDSNPSRWPLHPLWEALLEAADRLEFGPFAAKAKPHQHKDYLLDQQSKSAYGMLRRIAVTLSENDPAHPLSLKDVLQRFPRAVQFYHNDTLWENDVREQLKRKRLGQ